jgi:Protein of unknown function (DUF3829)
MSAPKKTAGIHCAIVVPAQAPRHAANVPVSLIGRRSMLSLAASFMLLAYGGAPAIAQQLSPRDLTPARAKLTAYDQLYNATHKLQASWERYIRSVNMDSGPTGKETRLIGVTIPDAAAAEMANAEKLLASTPVVAEADRAAKALIHFYREAAPMMAEAAGFYPAYNPVEDLGRAGQVWHRTMKSLMTFTIDARSDLYKATDAMRGEIEPLELALLEKKGRDAKWLVRAASVEARKVRDVFPKVVGDIDTNALGARLAAFSAVAESCQAFERSNPGKLLMFLSAPKSFLTTMERQRGQLVTRPNPQTATSADLVVALTAYAQLVQMADLYFANHP